MRDEDKSKSQLIQELQTLRAHMQSVGVFEAELREAERESEERRLYLESLFGCVPDAIITSDNRGTVIEWNGGAERLFGYTAEQARGQNIDDLIGGDVELTHKALSGDQLGFAEVVRQCKDKRTIQVILSCAPILVDGELVGAVAVYTDLTEQKRLEAQLRHMQRLEAIGRLAGGIAHDFNNLLTAIQGYTELALDNLEHDPSGSASRQPPVSADLQEIARVSERARVLVRQLLTFSRKQTLASQVLHMHDLIDGVRRMLRPLIGEDVVLETDLLAAHDQIEADPGQIEQMIVNLALNARDAMPRGGKLRIGTRNAVIDDTYHQGYLDPAPGPYLVLSIRDTGSGMPPHVMEHLFEPFFTTKDADRGTGLGLTTVYGVLHQMGGDIHVQSALGQGTTFRLYLPQAHETVRAAIDTQTKGHVPTGSETTLVVEDDETVRLLISRVLTRQGYTVLEARDSREALAYCETTNQPIDLLLTDVVLPGTNGHDLAARFLDARPDVPVIYMSGYLDDSVVALRDLGPDVALVHKPFTPTTLANKVREMLDRAHT